MGKATVLLLYLDSIRSWEKLFPFGSIGLLRGGLSIFTLDGVNLSLKRDRASREALPKLGIKSFWTFY